MLPAPLRWLVCICAACTLCAGTQWLRAGDGPEQQRLLVFTNGRIMQGRISLAAGGFLVEQANGNVFVPAESVKFQADDLDDAYRQQNEALPDHSADSHLALARWCLLYRLYDDAREQLKVALRQEPDRDDVRQLLQRLDTMLDPQAAPAEPNPQRPHLAEILAPDVESLGGLSRETADQFTTRVQPILMNKCGNATCHGTAADNDFQLTPVRLGRSGHRIHTERNLAVVMRYVDLQRPDLSRLLTEPRGQHAQSLSSVFPGSDGSRQFATLREWVRDVARERNEESSERPLTGSPVVTAGDAAGVESLEAVADQPEQPIATETDPLLEEIQPDLQRDPFDPEVFNRRFAGRTPNE